MKEYFLIEISGGYALISNESDTIPIETKASILFIIETLLENNEIEYENAYDLLMKIRKLDIPWTAGVSKSDLQDAINTIKALYQESENQYTFSEKMDAVEDFPALVMCNCGGHGVLVFVEDRQSTDHFYSKCSGMIELILLKDADLITDSEFVRAAEIIFRSSLPDATDESIMEISLS